MPRCWMLCASVACTPLPDPVHVPFSSSVCGAGPFVVACELGTEETTGNGFATMIHGPAGGWSLSFSVAVEDAEAVLVDASAYAVERDDREIGRTGGAQLLDFEGSCGGEAGDLRVYLDPAAIDAKLDSQEAICRLWGEDVRVEIAVTDLYNTMRTTTCGVVASALPDLVDYSYCF